ncbi:hypothetical protein FRC14_004480 [Serendipita sp. 396]|nr:hypothetical protein FRC14_004480 [Serendipita sp. 396]
MSDSGRRVGSPTPSGINQNGTGSASGPVLSGRNRAASTSKSVFSVKSNKTTASYQLTGSKKINTAPRELTFRLLSLQFLYVAITHILIIHVLLELLVVVCPFESCGVIPPVIRVTVISPQRRAAR